MYLCQFGNTCLYTKIQYTSTNYYLYYICTNTGGKIIQQFHTKLKWKNSNVVRVLLIPMLKIYGKIIANDITVINLYVIHGWKIHNICFTNTTNDNK